MTCAGWGSRFFIGTIVAVNIFLPFAFVWAETPDELTNRYKIRIERTLYDLSKLQPNCPTCSVFVAGEESVHSPVCRKTYRDFYKVKDRVADESKEDSEVNISLTFGYMDYLRDVDDYYVALAFGMQVTSKCYRGQSACGFTQDPDDAGLFRRQVKMIGPDGKERVRTVNLRMRYSSVSPSEIANRNEKKADQDRRSERTCRFFAEALQKSDMAMYVGHARDGGGPDCGPPVLNSAQRPDYNWYHKNHPGVNLMHEALTATNHKPKILAIFACAAKDHFYKKLRADAPNTGLILSGSNEFEGSVGQAIATLDSVLGMRCEDDFNKSVNVVKNIPVSNLPGGFVIAPMMIDGVFKK